MSRLLPALVPLYLLLAILLGGSAQGVWGNLALQLLGIGLIGLAAVLPRPSSGGWMARFPAALLLAALVIILLQLVPLPPGLWSALPGREAIAQGFRSVGYPLPYLPLSETPFETLAATFSLIPPIAVFVGIAVFAPPPRWLALAIVAGTIVSILFGALQVAGGENSWAYLFENSSLGAVGFFANRNHMATLLLVAIPCGAALLGTSRSDRRSVAGRYGIGAVLLLLLLVALALNGSLAAFSLVAPVLIASLTLLPGAAAWRRVALPLASLILLAGVAFIAASPVSLVRENDLTNSVSSRAAIWSTSRDAISDSFPAGTGLGSFDQVYQQYEDAAQVTDRFVNHAHNDYLEVVMEVGLGGAMLLALFLGWWGMAAFGIWTSQLGTPFARGATIASAAILAHSAVDFPLRTATIACIFAAAVALIAQHFRPVAVAQEGQRRPARHVRLG